MNLFKKIFNKNNSETEKIINETEYLYSIGEFNINEVPENVKNNELRFLEYIRRDGEWIEKGEKICILKIIETNSYRYQGLFFHAEESGFIELTLEKDQIISDKIILYKIHKAGEYKNENSPYSNDYKHYFYVNEPRFFFKQWLKNDGDIVCKGDEIYEFKLLNNITKIHRAEKDGYLDINDLNKSTFLEKNELLYSIRDNDNKRINQKFENVSNIILDEFDGTKTIEWIRVSSISRQSQGIACESDDNLIDFTFSFNYRNENDYIIFHFNPKQIRPKNNDVIYFLFENGEQIAFEINNNPINSKNQLKENIIEYKSYITENELALFASTNLKKWKILLKTDDKNILGGNFGTDKNYFTKNNLNIVIKKFANDYIKIIRLNIENYKPRENRYIEAENIEPKVEYLECYVYLMHDTSNNFYKIGISNNPSYREKTLQSEKPTIENIAAKKYPIRKIAESFEKSLHQTYADKRIRGEWFKLDEIDVKHIIESLK